MNKIIAMTQLAQTSRFERVDTSTTTTGSGTDVSTTIGGSVTGAKVTFSIADASASTALANLRFHRKKH